jgi:hypothetical protein
MRTWLVGLLFVLAVATCPTARAVTVLDQGTWTTTLQPRDYNSDGVTDGYYDTLLDITWLANWNYWGQQRNFDEFNLMIAPSLNILGTTGWRLPSALNPDGTGPCEGFNCVGSEFGQLWYVELGNTSGVPATNTGPFVNVQTFQYWTNTVAPNVFFAWKFSTEDGSQTTSAVGFQKFAEFVHDGDVFAIPEPATLSLYAGGLVVVLGLRGLRRKKLRAR